MKVTPARVTLLIAFLTLLNVESFIAQAPPAQAPAPENKPPQNTNPL
jgi:hypothetical protein